MNTLDHQQLKLNIEHIFESGANEIRVFEMAKQFAERYAEAYYQQRMKDRDSEDLVFRAYGDIRGAKAMYKERERILGIIEEEYNQHLKRLGHHGEGPSMIRVELLKELIEKIKGLPQKA